MWFISNIKLYFLLHDSWQYDSYEISSSIFCYMIIGNMIHMKYQALFSAICFLAIWSIWKTKLYFVIWFLAIWFISNIKLYFLLYDSWQHDSYQISSSIFWYMILCSIICIKYQALLSVTWFLAIWFISDTKLYFLLYESWQYDSYEISSSFFLLDDLFEMSSHFLGRYLTCHLLCRS